MRFVKTKLLKYTGHQLRWSTTLIRSRSLSLYPLKRQCYQFKIYAHIIYKTRIFNLFWYLYMIRTSEQHYAISESINSGKRQELNLARALAALFFFFFFFLWRLLCAPPKPKRAWTSQECRTRLGGRPRPTHMQTCTTRSLASLSSQKTRYYLPDISIWRIRCFLTSHQHKYDQNV